MRDYDIESDLKQEKFQSIKLVQGDRGNKIKINVYEDGQPVKLTGCSITAKYKRADGEIINDGVIENIHDNSFDAVMDSSITKVAGTLKMLFTIEKDAVKVSAFLLLADVREGIGESSSSDGSAGGGEVTGDLSDYYKKIETYSRKEIDAQFKDIAKQISNIKTDVEVTKDITVLTNDNTAIPTTAQQQEVTVEFIKGTIMQVPAFTNMITTSTVRQTTYMKNTTCLNENELEYSANGTDTTGYFRYQLPSLSENHKIYCSIWLKTTATDCKAMCGTTNNFFNVANEYTKISGIFTYSSGACYLGYSIQTMNSTDTYYMKKPLQIDLTTLYGEGNEPTLEEFEKLIGDNWCLGTYTPSETVSNDFTIKSYKSDNSLLDTFNSSTDTSINVIGGGYVNVTADVLPTSVILKNVKYTEKQNIGTATPSSPTKEFEGLKWGVVGESLSDSSINADTKYHKIIKEKTGITIQELAKGGTGYTAGYSTNDTYYDRILTLDTDCDIVTIFGSVNDWKNNQYNSLCKEIGTISDTYDDSKSVIENTFYANLNRTFDALVDRVPKAQIIVFGAMPYYGVNQTYFKNVRDALIAVCNDRHIPYNDMFDSTGFYRIMNNGIYAQAYTTDYSGTNYDTQTSFGHPNNLAHKKIIAPMFLTELRKHLLL
jgi:lysophospholipase L1-like esterase